MSGSSPPDLPSRVTPAALAGICISTLAAVPASAVPAPEPAPEPADTRVNKIVAGENAGSARTPHSSPGGRRMNKIIFLAMTLARVTKPSVGFSCPVSTHSVAPALRPPFLLAAARLAVTMPRLPRPPSSCFFAAILAAVARQRVAGVEPLLTSFQQTNPTSGTASSPPQSLGSEPACLIFSGS
jgi:hypothetical protein